MSPVDFCMGDRSKSTYAWTDSEDPESIAFVQFLNAGLTPGFWKPRLPRKSKRWDGRPSKAIWAEIRERIFARDDYTCGYCSTRGGRLECDHIIPHSRGGSDDDDNLVTACLPCNRSKRDRTPEEWKAA